MTTQSWCGFEKDSREIENREWEKKNAYFCKKNQCAEYEECIQWQSDPFHSMQHISRYVDCQKNFKFCWFFFLPVGKGVYFIVLVSLCASKDKSLRYFSLFLYITANYQKLLKQDRYVIRKREKGRNKLSTSYTVRLHLLVGNRVSWIKSQHLQRIAAQCAAYTCILFGWWGCCWREYSQIIESKDIISTVKKARRQIEHRKWKDKSNDCKARARISRTWFIPHKI